MQTGSLAVEIIQHQTVDYQTVFLLEQAAHEAAVLPQVLLQALEENAVRHHPVFQEAVLFPVTIRKSAVQIQTAHHQAVVSLSLQLQSGHVMQITKTTV